MTYMISRRCAQRQFLLPPTAHVALVFQYCLAVAAQRTGVLIHAFTVMSNHYHLIATDPSGRLPEFTGWLNEFVAKALNAHHGRWENFWAPEQPSYVRLVEADDMLAKTVYTVANPVAAGLVSHGDKWPGLRVFSPGRRTIRRPAGFFREKGSTPDVAILSVEVPPLGLSSHDAYLRIRDHVGKHEAEIRQRFCSDGRHFLGAQGVRKQRVSDAPTTAEPRRVLSPTVACRNKWLRVDTLRRCKDFLRRYREAFHRWMGAGRDALFPAGTYQMVRRHAVAVAPS